MRHDFGFVAARGGDHISNHFAKFLDLNGAAGNFAGRRNESEIDTAADGTTAKGKELVKNAQQHGLRCIVDSSGDALAAALDVGNIELVKPNQKELSALVQRDLSQPDDVRLAAQELIRSGKVQRVVVSLGAQGALGVDAQGSVQVVPPPMKSQSTVGAGDSMVGAMTLRLAENASLEDMVRFGVAAGSAATINQGTRLCSQENTQKIYDYLRGL